uniref:Malectin-like domain-containing protein n=1 Tax=Ananas comosus var. bracteatus TaxID=296719 RepID=A0A6V7QI54_ANACO|nr:unnamed protein product [Ananas comosus var. bracteatus]
MTILLSYAKQRGSSHVKGRTLDLAPGDLTPPKQPLTLTSQFLATGPRPYHRRRTFACIRCILSSRCIEFSHASSAGKPNNFSSDHALSAASPASPVKSTFFQLWSLDPSLFLLLLLPLFRLLLEHTTMLLLFFLLSFPFLLSSAPTPTPSPKPNPNNDPFLGEFLLQHRLRRHGQLHVVAGAGLAVGPVLFSGDPGMVAEPHRFSQPQERTLRFFPPVSSGKKNCYSVPVPSGRYYIRTFSVYDNYDAKLRSPSFDVSVEGTLVFTWRSPWPEAAARSGAYSDLISPVLDAVAHVCFYSMATDPPVVASLEIAPVHPLAYDAASTGPDLILVNYGRLTAGGNLFGPGFTADPDAFSRVWQPDADFRSPTVKIKALSAGGHQIFGSNQPPNYFPTLLYETAVTTVDPADALQYLLPVDTRLSYMIWFHFAEIDAGVNSAGRRVFDVVVGGNNVTRIDIFKERGAGPGHREAHNLWARELCNGSSGHGHRPEPRDLASQGLKGYISDQISLLTNLVSLNLSSNSLGGTLPPGLGQESLVRLDLSSNQFSGSIPGSLGSSTLQIA